MKGKLRSVLNFFGWCAAVLALIALAGVITAREMYRQYERRAAAFDLTKIDNLPQRSEVRDAHGELYSYFGGENRMVVPLSAVSKNFINALLAREDTRFWEHNGVDLQGVLRALVVNLQAGETRQGGSTITQQLARNACELKERSLDRKALEAVLARHIEATYSKEQILEFYVNRIYFGAGCYGIEAASRRYFGKAAADLSISEGAALAGLIRSPNRLALSRNPDEARGERDTVIARMQELGFITPDEAASAKAQRLQIATYDSSRVRDDSVMDAVMRELASLLSRETIEFGGLRVFMTIDPALQRLAQNAADRKLSEIEEQKGYPHPKKKDFVPNPPGDEEKPTDYLQAAVAIVENQTGAIRALVGGRDYEQSKYSRAMLSKRQVGSTFKSFVYAAAFDRGMLPGTMVDDSKIAPGEFKDIPKKWSPANSDNEYMGLQPAALGLLKSRNTMSVRVGEFSGLRRVREFARAAGFQSNIPEYPVVFLGGFDSTVREVTSAYTIFPNLGIARPTYLISSVEDADGTVLWKAPREEKRVCSADSAWMTSSILQEVMKKGTASKAASMGWKKIGAGKTGTTNDFFDAWFVGYTSSLTCGVWVGMDQPQTILEKGYGSTLALPIWVEIMQHAPENIYPAAPFQAPEQLVKVNVCSVSSGQATSQCIAHKTAYQVELPQSRVPREACRTHPEPPPMPVTYAPAYVTAPQQRVAPAYHASPSVDTTPVPPPLATPARAGVVSNQSTYPPVQAEVNTMRDTAPPTPSPSQTYTGAVQTEPPPAWNPAPADRSGALQMYQSPSGGRIVHWPPTTTTRQSPSAIEPPPIAEPRRVEVRRAQPATPYEGNNRRVEVTSNGRMIEERITERMPNGRIRTTIVRRPQPRNSAMHGVFSGRNDD